jgi:hypothetical protein
MYTHDMFCRYKNSLKNSTMTHEHHIEGCDYDAIRHFLLLCFSLNQDRTVMAEICLRNVFLLCCCFEMLLSDNTKAQRFLCLYTL